MSTYSPLPVRRALASLQAPTLNDRSWAHIPANARMALRLRAYGVPSEVVALRTNLSVKAISTAEREYPEYVETVVRLAATPDDVLRPMLSRAAQAYYEALAPGADSRTRTVVATHVFEWLWGRPLVRSISDSHGHISITFSDEGSSEGVTIDMEGPKAGQMEGQDAEVVETN